MGLEFLTATLLLSFSPWFLFSSLYLGVSKEATKVAPLSVGLRNTTHPSIHTPHPVSDAMHTMITHPSSRTPHLVTDVTHTMTTHPYICTPHPVSDATHTVITINNCAMIIYSSYGYFITIFFL